MDRNNSAVIALTTALLESKNSAEIVGLAAELVKNPVALIDAGYNMIAWSHRENVPDKTWQERTAEGYWDYDFVAAVKRHSSRKGNKDPYSAIISDISPLRRRIDTLALHGSVLGYSVVLEVEQGSLDEVEDEVYRFTRQVLTKTLETKRAYYLHRGQDSGASIMLRDLLSLHFPNRVLFQERIKGSAFDRNTVFQLFTISLEGYIPENAGDEKLKSALQALFPGSWSAYSGENIVLLVDQKETSERAPKAFAEFKDFLGKTGLRCGASALFDDLYTLPLHKKQSARALEVADAVGSNALFSEGPVISYESCKPLDMLLRIPAEERHMYCHSHIMAAHKHDAEHGTAYLPTIFSYLNAKCSIHSAAETLHLHHNSVYYRLQKAKELFSLDFALQYTNMHYHLSCVILLYTQ